MNFSFDSNESNNTFNSTKMTTILVIPDLNIQATTYYYHAIGGVKKALHRSVDESWADILHKHMIIHSHILQSTYSSNGITWTIYKK